MFQYSTSIREVESIRGVGGLKRSHYYKFCCVCVCARAFYINQFEKSLGARKTTEIVSGWNLAQRNNCEGKDTLTKRSKRIRRCQDDAGESHVGKLFQWKKRRRRGERRKKIFPSRRNRDRDVLWDSQMITLNTACLFIAPDSSLF